MGFHASVAFALAALAGLAPASGEEVACDAARGLAAGQAPPCSGREAEEDVFASAQLRRVVARQHHQAAGAAAVAAAEEAAEPSAAAWPRPSRALGLLQLDGYYWPTQPGDINDLRTWCTVQGVDGEDYKCKAPKMQGEDEFGLKIATIVNGSWPKIQLGQWTGLEDSFAQAVEYLLRDKSVHAIMGNAGWFTWYQYRVSQIMRDLATKHQLKPKPWLGGSPAMVAALGSLIKGIGEAGEKFLPIHDWSLLKKPNDRLLLLTSNTKLQNITRLNEFLMAAGVAVRKNSSLSEQRAAMEAAFDINLPEDDGHTLEFVVFLIQMRGLLQHIGSQTALRTWIRISAQKLIIVPWEATLGYGAAVTGPGAMFHNVGAQIRGSSDAASQLLSTIIKRMRKGQNIVGIIMESTEMPAYSNWVRDITGLPVWDSTVVGKCLMASAPDYDADAALKNGNAPTLFNTPSFRSCMMGWWDADRFEPSAGYQKDGSILHYDTMNLTTSQLDSLTCTGGRPTPFKAIGRAIEEFDTGKFGPPKVHASCLKVTPCGGRTWQGQTCPPSEFGGKFSTYGGCFCEGSCPAGYYCGGDEPFNVTGLEGIHGGQGYVYGIRGEDYPTYSFVAPR